MSATLRYGLTYTVEVALSAATGTYGAWDSGLWDTATWGPDIIWTDVSQWVRSWSTQRKFSRDLQVWESGTASIVLDDRDGRFNPNNLSGPYVTAGVTGVRPWRPVRIRTTWAGIAYDVYRGYVVSWPETIIPAGPNAGDAHVTMVCQDEWSSLARFNGLPQTLIGGGETTGTRMHRILNAANHTGNRNIADGVMTCQPTDLNFNTVAGLKLTADSEGGAVWVEADGTVTSDGLFALNENSRSSTVQAVFGDFPGDLPVFDIGQEYNGDLLVNIAAWNRAGGLTQTSADGTSRALYGDKQDTSQTSLVCETDTQVKTLTDLWVQRYKDPEYRFTNITIKPRNSPNALFPQVFGRRVRDLIRVRRQPPGGITVTQDVFVAGISHTCTAEDFITVFDLWSGKPYTSTPFVNAARWGSALWGTATWFY